MKPWKLIVTLIVVFLAGGLAGGGIGAWSTKRMLLSPPKSAELAVRLQAKLDSDLHFTPEQAAKVNPILERTAERMSALHRTTFAELDHIMIDTIADIRPQLTPGQLPKFDQLAKHRSKVLPPPQP